MKTEKDQPLPVLIRYEGDHFKYPAGWHLSDLIALFPTEPGTNDPNSISCYSTMGQHSHADKSYVRATLPVTLSMEKAMLDELHSVGYHNLKVVEKMTVSHHAARRKSLRRS